MLRRGEQETGGSEGRGEPEKKERPGHRGMCKGNAEKSRQNKPREDAERRRKKAAGRVWWGTKKGRHDGRQTGNGRVARDITQTLS